MDAGRRERLSFWLKGTAVYIEARDMNHNPTQAWEEFLNQDVTRPRLIAASIYIAVFEALKDAIIIMSIQLLLDVALGSEERSRSYYNRFREQGGSG